MPANGHTVPIAFDDGTQAYVPEEKVQDAVRDGGRLVQSMTFNDGSQAWVPLENVHAAISDGGQLVPPPVPKPQIDMQDSALGHLYAGEDPNADAKAQTIQAHPWMKPVAAVGDALKEAEVGPTIGAVKGAAQSAIGVANLPGRAANAMGANVPAIPTAPFMETSGPGEAVGHFGENLLEFLLGDEAIKGFTSSQKFGHAAKVSKLLESSPRIKAALELGLNAIRQGVVGGGQALAHGESAGDAATTGAVAGGISAGLGATSLAAGALKNIIKPGVEEIAGVNVPVRASSGSRVAQGLENVADSGQLEKFAAQQTQPGARQVIGKVATDAATASADALPIAGQGGIPANVKNFGEAADALRAKAKPIFQTLDQLSQEDANLQNLRNKLTGDKGTPKTFSDWQKQENAAFRAGNFDAAEQAKAQQEALLDRYKDHFDPTDLDNARALWSRSSALDKIDAALSKPAVVAETPIKLRATGTPDPGYLQGKQMARTIRALDNRGLFDQAGLSPDHVQNLRDLSTLLEKSNNVARLNPILKALVPVLHLSSLGFEPAAAKTLGWVMADPEALNILIKGLKSGATVSAISQGVSAATHVYNPTTQKIEPIGSE